MIRRRSAFILLSTLVVIAACGGSKDEPSGTTADGDGTSADGGRDDDARGPDAPTAACHAVATLGECREASGCFAQRCPNCAGETTFARCLGASEPTDCPRPSCDGPCDELDEATCSANGACHPVYADSGVYRSCGAGATADCSGKNAVCAGTPPTCPDGYSLSYGNGCEGCVRTAACSD